MSNVVFFSVLSQFEFSSFVNILVFEFLNLSQFEFKFFSLTILRGKKLLTEFFVTTVITVTTVTTVETVTTVTTVA